MSIPLLFQEYPSLEGIIPWLSLANTPTPVKRLEKLENRLKTDTPIWVKLDNLTSPKYGGNKVRKLEFIIADALRKKKKTIATLGGIGTNHGLATTIFGKDYGLNTRLYLIDQPITEDVLRNLKLDFFHGAELKYVKNYLGIVLYFYVLDRLRQKQVYWLPAGGTTPLGVLGYVNAAFELKQQIEAGSLPEPAVIFVAVGTTGTMAGLELGLRLTGLKTSVLGIRVAGKMAATLGKAKNLIKNALKILRQDPKLKKFRFVSQFEIIDQFYGGKYGRATEEALKAVKILKETEKIPLETTYTGKTVAALLDHINQTKSNDPILFWNTFNSVDLSSLAAQVDYHQLPPQFHSLFEKKVLN
jgi:D-cysteine desulfhydrase